MDELKKLLAEATPRPWKTSSSRSAADHPAHVVSGQDYIADCEWRLEEQNANAALICAAVNALPELLALREENERLREALTTIGHSLVCANRLRRTQRQRAFEGWQHRPRRTEGAQPMTREELIEVMARAIEPRCWEMMDEVMARALNPRAWEVMDAELNRMLQKYQGQNVAYPSDQFQHKESMEQSRAALRALVGEK